MDTELVINKDYIGVVKEKNGLLSINKVLITQDTILIKELEAMRANPNKTIFDMQNLFEEYYPKDKHSNNTFNYIYPADYYDAYISRVSYPNFIEYEKYKSEIAELEKKLISKYIDNEADANALFLLKQTSEETYKIEYQKRMDKVKEGIEEEKQYFKKHFEPERYIYAFNYYEKVKELSTDDKSKMISTERIGWTDITFPIDDNFCVYLKTNFGYGVSSYFYCNIIYKGISIVPYSDVVKYSYVQWMDFIRYTRKYRPDRKNWMPSLEFAVETANLAKTNPEEFIQVWIVNELKEMMEGLRAIFTSDDACIRKYLEFKTEVSIGNYNRVRNFHLRDKKEYNVLPQEKIIAFKAEKITGTLNFLENLQKLKDLTEYVNACIDEIIDMNKKLTPEISRHLDFIGNDIKRLEHLLVEEQSKYDKIEKEINEVYKPQIKKLLEQMKKKSPHWHFSEYDAESEFKRTNPSYEEILSKSYVLRRKIEELQEDIRLRRNLFDQLEICMKRINKYLLAS